MTQPIDPNTEPTEQPAAMDDWAAALAEQAAAQVEQQAQANVVSATTDQLGQPVAQPANLFQPLEHTSVAANLHLETLQDVPVQLTVELGRTRLTIRELLQLGQGSVVELAGLAGEPLDILVNGHLIAQGEVVVVGDHYGVRLTDILTPSDRLQRLSSTR